MEEQQFLHPGTLLFNGGYRIVRVLGSGGFGVTYLAIDLNLDKEVAIKEFFPSSYCSRDDSGSISNVSLSSKELIERLKEKFLKEAKNIARLKHPNIITISGSFKENDTVYYVMEYLKGGNVSDLVKANGPLPLATALDYIRQVGEALAYLHSRNMNHLDVKPANLMLRDDGSIVLIDFGLSKQYDASGNQTSTTPVGISHGYAPIEQYRNDGVSDFSPATDIYSMGATFYYMLTGTVPPDAAELIGSPLPQPEGMSWEMYCVLRKAMSPIRGDRYQSVQQFYDDLVSPPTQETPLQAIYPDSEPTRIASGGAPPLPPDVVSVQPIYPESQIGIPLETPKKRRPMVIALVLCGLILATAITFLIVNTQIKKNELARIEREQQILADSLAAVEAARIEAARIDSLRLDSIRLEQARMDSIAKEDEMALKPLMFSEWNFSADAMEDMGFKLYKKNLEYDIDLEMETGTITYTRTFNGRRIDYVEIWDTCGGAYLVFHDSADKERFIKDLKSAGYIKDPYGSYNKGYHSIWVEGNKFYVQGC